MSPFSSTCVCVSISPGRQVSLERSITFAVPGTAAGIAVILSPSISKNTFFRGCSDLPSIRVPQRMKSGVALVVPLCPAQIAARAATEENTARNLRIVPPTKFPRRNNKPPTRSAPDVSVIPNSRAGRGRERNLTFRLQQRCSNQDIVYVPSLISSTLEQMQLHRKVPLSHVFNLRSRDDNFGGCHVTVLWISCA